MQQLSIIQFHQQSFKHGDDAAWLARFGNQYLFTCEAAETRNVHILTETPEITSLEIAAFLQDRGLSSKVRFLPGQTLDRDLLAAEGLWICGNLSRIVYALRCIYEDGMDGNFVTFSYPGEQNYFVQFSGNCGEADIVGDAASNECIQADFWLDDQQIDSMERRGWKPPGPGELGFYRQFRAVNDIDRYQIALEVKYIFENIYQVDFTQALSINLVLE